MNSTNLHVILIPTVFTLNKQRQKFGLDPSQITLGNGSNDLIELIAHTFVSEQDEVIFSQYAFIVYPLVTQALNAKAVVIPAKTGVTICLNF